MSTGEHATTAPAAFTGPPPAPWYVVAHLAALAPWDPDPTGRPTQQQWRAQLTALANEWWAEAWTLGAAWGVSLARLEASSCAVVG